MKIDLTPTEIDILICGLRLQVIEVKKGHPLDIYIQFSKKCLGILDKLCEGKIEKEDVK